MKWLKRGKTDNKYPLDFLNGSRIVVTGGKSFCGQAIVDRIMQNAKGCLIFDLPHSDCDLLDKSQVRALFKLARPNYVIHLASLNGNIKYNSEFPADIFYITSQIALNVLSECANFKVKKVLSLLSSCSYPSNETGVYKEEDFWKGSPDQTVEAHGFAKRIIPEFGRQLYKQFGLRSISLVYNTIYGPNDNYDLNKTKVVGSLIKKFCDAQQYSGTKIDIWGSGEVRREFIYVKDVADTALRAFSSYDDCMNPLNIGCAKDYKISELAQIIAKISGFTGSIWYNKEKPDGAARKLLDNSKMRTLHNLYNYEFTPLEKGLKETIEWYRNNYLEIKKDGK